MAQLPLDRIEAPEAAFTNVGLDGFGPFNVRIKRSEVKRYGLIFVCLASRAIHLEVCNELTTSSFMNGLRCFIAHRGPLRLIRSDCGSNYLGAMKELDTFYVRSELQRKNIDWVLNPPAASNFGGCWEAMIRLVRKVLTHSINRQVLTDEISRTLFCEAEFVVNSRPLTTPSDDMRDATPLTPNQILTLKGSEPCIADFDESDSYSRKRWKQVQYLAQQFWQRWTKEYVSDLQRRQKWSHTSANLAEGDIVLVADPASPRSSWPLAKVVKVKKSADGLVRSATVQSAHWTLVRPINKMVKLFTPHS